MTPIPANAWRLRPYDDFATSWPRQDTCVRCWPTSSIAQSHTCDPLAAALAVGGGSAGTALRSEILSACIVATTGVAVLEHLGRPRSLDGVENCRAWGHLARGAPAPGACSLAGIPFGRLLENAGRRGAFGNPSRHRGGDAVVLSRGDSRRVDAAWRS